MILFIIIFSYLMIGFLLTKFYINSILTHTQNGWNVCDQEFILYIFISPLFIFFISPYIIYRQLTASKEKIVEEGFEYTVKKYHDGLVSYNNMESKIHKEGGKPAQFYVDKKGNIVESIGVIYAINGKEYHVACYT